MAAEDERLIANQQTSRGANERLRVLAAKIVAEDRVIPFLCECADADCLGRVDMTGADYGELHLDRNRYAILPDHQRMDGEEVVAQRALYDIVSKAALG